MQGACLCLHTPIWDHLDVFDEEFTDQAKQLHQTRGIPTQRNHHATTVPMSTLPPQGGNAKKESNE